MTEPLRNHVSHQMRMYEDLITPILLLQARANLRKLRENSSEAAPLTAKDLFPAKISARKTRDNHQEKIKKLQEEFQSEDADYFAVIFNNSLGCLADVKVRLKDKEQDRFCHASPIAL